MTRRRHWSNATARAIAVATLAASCAYVLPATWRSFHADPDDAAPAVTRALDAEHTAVAVWDQAHHKIVTNWMTLSSGVSKTRERFVISWERDSKDATLTVYVRHEAQDQNHEPSARWGAIYHDSDRESALLDLIEKELAASNAPARPTQPTPGRRS